MSLGLSQLTVWMITCAGREGWLANRSYWGDSLFLKRSTAGVSCALNTCQKLYRGRVSQRHCLGSILGSNYTQSSCTLCEPEGLLHQEALEDISVLVGVRRQGERREARHSFIMSLAPLALEQRSYYQDFVYNWWSKIFNGETRLNNSLLQQNKRTLPVIWHFTSVLFQTEEFPFWLNAIICTRLNLLYASEAVI